MPDGWPSGCLVVGWWWCVPNRRARKVEKLIKVDGLVMESGREVVPPGKDGALGCAMLDDQVWVVVDMYPRCTISAVLCTSWGAMKIFVLLIDSDPKMPLQSNYYSEYQQKSMPPGGLIAGTRPGRSKTGV
jgi:hypothetical protein